MRDRLFVGVFPTGISYADRGREKHGDYARCAFLNFRTLDLEMEPDCPRQLREEIVRHARKIQARRGERFETSSSGQYVVLGRDASRRDSGPAAARRQMKAVNRVMKGKHGTGKEWFKGVGTDPERSRYTGKKRRLGHASHPFAIEAALSEREMRLRKAAYAASHGELRGSVDQPNEPNTVEDHYLRAIDAFQRRRPTLGYDLLERGDHRALLRYGRARRRR